ncbi:MAG TPA: tRNA lysidine(34) synthetase TilS [Flavobacterium sp.]|nr:tRNA lysidine(34) synthetase TilS [Flavobacterium sp.]
MLQKLQNHINLNLPFLKEKKLLLAVSGGIDSMVLVNLCHQLQLNFAVAHCNFQLRGNESDEDEMLVIQTCQDGYIPYFLNSFNTLEFAKENKLSIQLAARKLRYDWFYKLINENGFDYILTAHHLDDSLETFLINFTRGSGLDGLTGIPEQNDKIVRPLLIFSRNEIEIFAQENNIAWREDSSNASDKYLRNKLRHDLLPILKELNPSLLSSFENTIKNLKQSQSLVDDASKMVYEKVASEQENQIVFDLDLLLKSQNHQAYLFSWLSDFGFTDWDSVYDLVSAQSGKQVMSNSHVLLKNRNAFLLFPRKENSEEVIYPIDKGQNEVKVPLNLTFCNLSDISVQSTNVIFVDAEKLQFPLTIRKWKEGDFFQPFGMNGKKKVSKFFKDEKFSLLEKSEIWLLSSNDKIVWIIGKRQDDRFKITETTTKILQINYIK